MKLPHGYTITEENGIVRICRGNTAIAEVADLQTLAALYCRLDEECESLFAFKESVDAALNSGDGSYRP